MAETVNIIEQVNIGGNKYNIASTAFGECNTPATTTAKEASIPGFHLTPGVTVHIRFTNTNSASNPTLSVNGTGNVPIRLYGTTPASTSNETSGWQAGAVISFTYVEINNEGFWYRDSGYNTNTTYTFDGTYNSSSNKAATVSTVTNAINNLDVSNISGFGVGKTLKTLTLTDGKIAATFQDIEIAAGKITSGTLSVARGGTGTDTLTSGQVLIGNGTSAVSTKAIDTAVTANSTNLITSGAVASAISGLTGAMHFVGTATQEITDGGTLHPTTANTTYSGTAGDVVLYSGKEFVWTGSAWELLGDEGSYALETAVVHKSDYTSGTILYGTGTGTYSALSPNTSTTKQILVMTESTPDWMTLTVNRGTGSFPTLDVSNKTDFLTASNAALTYGTAFSIPNVTSMTSATVNSDAVLVITNGTISETNISVPNVTGIDKTKKAGALTTASLSEGSFPTPTLTYTT